jgi:hypothetical protein
MLYLDTENSVLNPAAVRAIKNVRLGELKKMFGTYFGFTTATELANYFALSQAIGNRAAAQINPPAQGAAGSSASVAGARNSLNVRVDPLLAPVFAVLVDNGGGAAKILDVDAGSTGSIKSQLQNLLVGTADRNGNPSQPATPKETIARCVKIHYASSVGETGDLGQQPNRVFYNTLDRALPILDVSSQSNFAPAASSPRNRRNRQRREQNRGGTSTNAAAPSSVPTAPTSLNNANDDIKRRIAVVRAEHPLLVPGEKNSELLTVFFNGMPALEMTRATPVMNIKFYSSRQTLEDGRLAAITLQKFVEGARRVDNTAENLPITAIALASQVPTGSVPGQLVTAREFSNYTITGLELFRAPQTLINQESIRNRENYLAPVIDPMRPLASIKSFSMDVKSAYGLQGTRTATVEIVLHDRSRMGEFADFIKPDRYGESFLEVEYGWSHPDRLGENPYADLLNLTRAVDHFTVVTSNFNFDDVGQVNITLNLIGRGSSEITELSIVGEPAAGRIQQQIREVQRLSETINRLSSTVFPPPPENRNGNTNQRRREVRGTQGLSAVGDATNNLLMSREVLRNIQRLQEELNSRVRSTNPARAQAARDLQANIRSLVGTVGSSDTSPDAGSAISNVSRTLNQEIRSILNGLNTGTRTKENYYNDSFLETIDRDAWGWLKEKVENTRRPEPRTQPVPTTQLPSTGNDAGRARPPSGSVDVPRFEGAKVVSLGTLITAFVGRPLATLKNPDGSQKFEEVQIYFYNFNNRAGIMSHCNISQFPVQTSYFTREYGRLRMESVSRTVNLSVSEFMNFLSTKIVDDVLNPAYGISELYKIERDELVPENRSTFDNQMYNKMRQYNIGQHPDFVPPQLTFEIEATQPIVNGAIQEGKTIIKIHIYDKVCSSNSSYRELLALGTNNVMGVLSSYPGDTAQRQALESQAQGSGENVGVLRENWRQLQNDVVQRCLASNLITSMTPTRDANGREVNQYRFTGGAQQLKEFVMKGVPHIIYGAMGTTIRSSNVGSMSDPSLNSINMLRSLNSSPIQPNGEQTGGLPLSVYPVEVSLTSLGCPFLRYGQEIFIDYNTNTSIDNIYYITGLQHKVEAGSFETTIKFTAVDAFGQYRNLIGQLNTAGVTLSEIQSTTPSANTPTSTR